MMSKVVEHPFDLIKVRLQTQPTHPAPHYRGAVDCFLQTVAHEGVRGLFRGVSMPLFGATLENASLFLTYNQVQRALRGAMGIAPDAPLPMHMLAVAAAASGAAAGLVLTPVELIKCRMQVQMMAQALHGTNAAPLISAPALIMRTVREAGIRGMYVGLVGTLVRETGGGVAWFLTFEACTAELARLHAQRAEDGVKPSKKDLGSLELMASGALAGMAYNVSLFPADSVKSTMQTEREIMAHNPSAHLPTGFWGTLARIYRLRGIAGLYAGVGVTCLRSAPSSGLVFLVYNKLEQMADHYGL